MNNKIIKKIPCEPFVNIFTTVSKIFALIFASKLIQKIINPKKNLIMKKFSTLVMCCLAFMVTGIAQPLMGNMPERFNKERFLERDLEKQKPDLPQEKQFLTSEQFSSLKKEALQQVQAPDNKYFPPKLNTRTKQGDWYEPDTITTYLVSGAPNMQFIFTYYENGNCASYLKKMHNGIEWKNDVKNVYVTYDEQNNCTEYLQQVWILEQCVDNYQQNYRYNANNDVEEEIIRDKNGPVQGEWSIANHNTWGYDEQYNILSLLRKSRDNETGILQNSYFFNWKLDEHKNYIKYLEQHWDKGDWVNYSMDTAIYDERDRVLERISKKWVSGKWENCQKGTNTWNEQDLLSEMLEYWKNGDWRKIYGYWYDYYENNCIEILYKVGDEEANEWVNRERVGYGYDANNRIIADTLQNWNFGLNLWENDKNWHLGYDERGNMNKVVEQYWDIVTNEWINNRKQDALFNLKNKETDWLMQHWDLELKQWIDFCKTKTEYNSQYNPKLYLCEFFDLESKQWINEYRKIYDYDEGQNTTLFLQQEWINGTWVDEDQGQFSGIFYNNGESSFGTFHPGSKIVASYINTSTLSISDISTPEKENIIKLYPNPVSSTLNIETGNNDILPEVKIYSIQGALLINTKGNKIDVSSLANGFYIADVNGQTFKMVKQ